ncbi:rhodanese-like domain-containing protein [Dyadobacter sp. CY345]|uniref:rhodanese-like domain-containing protein n=1 Tax=Dyadobacter sp. CY345 TaxID=2909335 RepID=UPI001F301B11|nr:rhodanese-like domain-containing protein [Dyadobacter sp. CY345]MCF2443452.1 rhodanese-like domain-containing protein [Dyadobacter sp. CY345]
MGILSVLFGNNKTDFRKLIDQGALIVDVRSPQEFASGHIEGSINIPLNTIASKTDFLLNNQKTVSTVCLSGGRSSVAKAILKAAGIETFNGGAWNVLNQKIQ